MNGTNCALCEELTVGHLPAELRGRSRVSWVNENWCLLPSLGPVSPQHLLLVPRRHVTCSVHLTGAADLVHGLRSVVRSGLASAREGVLLFEHANSPTGGCGITHAHVHAVITQGVAVEPDFFPDLQASPVDSIASLASEHRELFWYLSDSGEIRAHVGLVMPSQAARRAIAKANSVPFDTNWRTYTHEPWLDSSRSASAYAAAALRLAIPGARSAA
jgi:diadenosine tetraphosphate (Ap4A) HIT family hydrolase